MYFFSQERRPVDHVRVLVASQHRVVEQFALVEMFAVFLDHLVRAFGRQTPSAISLSP
jgi:hypothetical protein